jgi:para-nitrobenzyl esterase
MPDEQNTPTRRSPVVRVTGGLVRGVHRGHSLAWRGIPFAAPPVGPLRFRAPRTVTPWRGIRDASTFGLVAPQALRGQFRGSGPGIPSGEDCLTINVLRAARPSSPPRNLPVMVFIHGGGYSTGSSRDFAGQGEAFVRSGRIVYVSFNYRLGALGYLDFSRYSTPERPIESNLGLRDQVAALNWVRDNIGAFGGDPANVTVFGESAGGNAVTTLFATPSAEGLFARGIAQSSPAGAVYTPDITGRWAGEFVTILRARTGTADDRAPAELLAHTPATELVSAAVALQIHTPDAYPGMFCLAPVADGEFLPLRPLDAFKAGKAHRVPLIIGTNDREGSIFRGRIDILPRSAGRIRSVFQGAPRSARAPMHAAYPELPARRAAADFGGDFGFWFPSVKVADHHSRFAAVYSYRFDVAPRLLKVIGLDATHGVELYALFDPDDSPLIRAMTILGGREPFSRAGQRMRDHWLEFVTAGTVPPAWPAYDESERLTMVIDTADRVESDPRRQRREAWELMTS